MSALRLLWCGEASSRLRYTNSEALTRTQLSECVSRIQAEREAYASKDSLCTEWADCVRVGRWRLILRSLETQGREVVSSDQEAGREGLVVALLSLQWNSRAAARLMRRQSRRSSSHSSEGRRDEAAGRLAEGEGESPVARPPPAPTPPVSVQPQLSKGQAEVSVDKAAGEVSGGEGA
eukprot:Hpha_TRINITY_DN15410_c3_g4::TRINITY_DN15410_c3_g4_i1::g.173501::m.173501